MTISDKAEYVVQSPQRHAIGGDYMPDWPSCSVEEAARLTGYHPEHIRRLLRAGLIEFTKIGPAYVIKVESLMAYVREMEATGDARTGPKGKRK